MKELGRVEKSKKEKFVSKPERCCWGGKLRQGDRAEEVDEGRGESEQYQASVEPGEGCEKRGILAGEDGRM